MYERLFYAAMKWVVIGPWIRLVFRPRYEGMENDRFILRAITDEIMYAILELSGREYVDIYAKQAKELSERSQDPVDPADTAA